MGASGKINFANDHIKATFNLQGAELSSVQYNGKEYMWQADPAFWNRHSPILFPTVGSLIDNTYFVDGKPYQLPQHGFGRNSTFALVEQTEKSAKFLLESDEETLQVYPFFFKLYISYILEGQSIQVIYEVENPSQEDLLFGIGGHPGFNCPLDPTSESFEDYVIDFHDGSAEKELYQLEGVYVAQGKYRLAMNQGQLDLDYSLFANDALIVDTQAPAKVTVKSNKSGAGFAMEYDEFKWLGIWTKGEGAGFLCLEPWNGIADKLGHNQNFEEKWGINRLAPGETYRASYRVEFF
jgi:galactose mutarotase-like enzyme